MADPKLTDYRRRLGIRKRQALFVASRIRKLEAAIRRRKKQLASGDIGVRAAARAAKSMGAVEKPPGSNRAPWLDAWVHKYHDPWMRGQPYCGLGCIVWWARAGKRLPKDTVSTVAIANRARRGDGFRHVEFEEARPGDLIVMHFGSGGPKHVGLARARPSNGQIATYEANTSPGNAGSQSNGGGCFPRTRSRAMVHTVARPI